MLCDGNADSSEENPMLKMRIRSLVQRMRALPCPACSAPRRVEWREVDAADLANVEDGPPPVCARCGRPRPVEFVEVIRG